MTLIDLCGKLGQTAMAFIAIDHLLDPSPEQQMFNHSEGQHVHGATVNVMLGTHRVWSIF